MKTVFSVLMILSSVITLGAQEPLRQKSALPAIFRAHAIRPEITYHSRPRTTFSARRPGGTAFALAPFAKVCRPPRGPPPFGCRTEAVRHRQPRFDRSAVCPCLLAAHDRGQTARSVPARSLPGKCAAPPPRHHFFTRGVSFHVQARIHAR